MAPASHVADKLPCSGSDVSATQFSNTTSLFHGEVKEGYDSVGAMEFIVTTLMVYSLMGISGLLLLRIRRRASRTHRVVTIREEHLQQYIKLADDLKLAGHRHKLKLDASRMVRHLQNLERQRSSSGSENGHNGTTEESTTLLDSRSLIRQNVQFMDSPKEYPNIISPSCLDRFALPSLPEEFSEYTEVVSSWPITSNPVTRLCEACSASSSNSFNAGILNLWSVQPQEIYEEDIGEV